MTKRNRYLYVDNLRLAMIMLVVMVHLAVTYSGIGGWYYYEARDLNNVSQLIFLFFGSFTQSYFMGFLFLLAGYFVPYAYNKKGFVNFIKGRLFRLGLPTLLYMLIIHPLTISIITEKFKMNDYVNYVLTLDFVGGSGPLWFALALLIFSMIYAFTRIIMDNLRRNSGIKAEKKIPHTKQIVSLIVIISIGAFLIRLIQPIDTSILNMQLCYFAQYIVLFLIGIKAYRYNWFEKIQYLKGIKWLKAAMTIGVVFWIGVLVLGGALRGELDVFKGGLHWQSLAYAIWESFTGVSMSIGLIALFKEKFNLQNRLLSVLSDNAFAVYVFHAPIIVFITFSLRGIYIEPLLKFVLTSLICLPTCFLVAFILKKMPMLNKII
ncbi:acyltransferase family protein [Vallitalea pronyensis]|uniref:Acyltransferase family protein n=1 Tax=Vallitalea pronyensis TaxID=1348613 RepID=A0A8J8MPR1_9FIRM|nr:acyltransferase family protein [Vallitalea pronyensis]QUI25297.1 acyltransferase family protein [Vallitalea pronyensis]